MQAAIAMSMIISMMLVGCKNVSRDLSTPSSTDSQQLESPVVKKLTDEDFLKARDGKLFNRKGEQIVLRGTNLGGWLIQESWMCPVDKPDRSWGNWDTLNAFEQRGFTEEQILRLFNAYQDSWITEKDLDRIQSMGMNCVRVPFWYRNFQKDDNGTYYGGDNMDENPGFQRLDWLLEQCGKRGIYVILDMHGAPGYQNDDHSSGRTNASELFEITESGETYRLRTIELWTRIAERYRDNPVVAAYDLLNEPMNGFDAVRKVDVRLWNLYDRIISAIRKVDTEHVITVEGVWELSNLPDPRDYGWTNVLYQTHNYNRKTVEIDQKIRDIQDRREWNVPILVGEFQSGGIWDYALSSYNSENVSWTTWTYKGVKSTLDDWFLYRNPSAEVINPETDSYERILEVWSSMHTENGFTPDTDLIDVLEKYTDGHVDNTMGTVGWTRYEAENIMVATILPAGREANFIENEIYSAGKAVSVRSLSGQEENISADWNGITHIAFTVQVEQAGKRGLRIVLDGEKGKHKISVGVNEETADTFWVDTDGPGKMCEQTLDVSLENGTNIIRISLDNTWNLDYIEVQNR